METTELKFPDPHEVETPPEIKGWDEWVPTHLRFSKLRENEEDAKFWFFDSLHWPEPLKPLDIYFIEVIAWTYNLPHTRFIRFPMVKGTTWRILNGYAYLGALPVTDPKEAEERSRFFRERADFYYKNWDKLYENWEAKIKAVIDELKGLELDVELPTVMDFDKPRIMKGEAGSWPSPAWKLIENFHKLKLSLLKAWEIHFEMLNLGYAAYGVFMDFCSKLFPGTDPSVFTKMLGGVRFYFAETQRQLERLAKLAIDLGVSEPFKRFLKPNEILENLQQTDAGRKWIKDYEETKEFWFNMWAGSGCYFCGVSWREDPSPIFDTIRAYIYNLEKGITMKSIEEIVRERDELVEEYRKLIKTDEEKRMFDELLELARKVVRYVENHKWWVENFYGSLYRVKFLQLAKTLVRYGILKEPEDIRFLTIYEIEEALWDLCISWSLEEIPHGTYKWPQIVERRKKLWRELTKYKPLPGLGKVPEKTDPFLTYLWGVTEERIKSWLGMIKPEVVVKEIKGFAGAPGVAEGIAKVITSPEELHLVEPGDILVAPTTDPSWTSVFPKIKAAVTDIGGIMSHAAIVGREYGIPVVVGTGIATEVIKTGQKIRVDGDKGIVTIL